MQTKWTEQKNELERLINVEHVSYEEIGRRYEVSGEWIKKVAKLLGIITPKRREINPKETFGKGVQKVKNGICLNCGEEFPLYSSSNGKYCCIGCKHEYEYKEYIKNWKNHEVTGTTGSYDISNYIRRYLFEKYNNSCQECGWNKVNKHTGNVPLQIHHIDGDCTNNIEDNLQLLCPNCHSLTENFGSRNRNSTPGRTKYYGRNKSKKERMK